MALWVAGSFGPGFQRLGRLFPLFVHGLPFNLSTACGQLTVIANRLKSKGLDEEAEADLASELRTVLPSRTEIAEAAEVQRRACSG